MKKYKVGIIGGTGMVGQRFITLMAVSYTHLFYPLLGRFFLFYLHLSPFRKSTLFLTWSDHGPFMIWKPLLLNSLTKQSASPTALLILWLNMGT